ncbi:hypothetical protein EV361DRAFT_843367 [Lentinula raphanica]|uniref:OTU domain-containing protein n=1 Tax=Lentinula raphanica TaxID=153919 RepID=A0AA38PHL8_9AGAR|nr:hypothetical protein F5878DRAFT_575693 [Lentinula raphanica]KAJ3973564.1 hypothetical protein EV361DRAFT_843367 [Lentinula raphanica]
MGSSKKQNKSYRTRATRSSGRSNLLPSDPLQNTAQLNDQLRSLGLYAAPTIGDGNCLFRALSDQYYGSPSRHVEVRREICDFIEAHPERYEGFVDVDEFGDSGVRKGKGGGLSAYVAGMRQNATYGGHMELSAFAHLTKRNIKVVQPGLVYVIQCDPSQPKSPKSPSKKAGDFPSIHTRSGPSKELDADETTTISPVEDQDSTIYVAYHDWEHFSSVRNLRGPHTGVPRVHETAPPPTASSSSSASPPPEEQLPPSKARKKERERREKEKKDAGRLKAKEKATSNSTSNSSSKPKSKAKDKQSSTLSSRTHMDFSATPLPVTIDPLSTLSHLTHLIPPPRVQRSPKRSFDETRRVSSIDKQCRQQTKQNWRRPFRRSHSPSFTDHGVLPSLKGDGPENGGTDNGPRSSEEPGTNEPGSKRPLTRRQRKKLGLPKPRNAPVSNKGLGKIIIPGGKSKLPRDASSAAEWTANGNGRVDVRGFRELKI